MFNVKHLLLVHVKCRHYFFTFIYFHFYLTKYFNLLHLLLVNVKYLNYLISQYSFFQFTHYFYFESKYIITALTFNEQFINHLLLTSWHYLLSLLANVSLTWA